MTEMGRSLFGQNDLIWCFADGGRKVSADMPALNFYNNIASL